MIKRLFPVCEFTSDKEKTAKSVSYNPKKKITRTDFGQTEEFHPCIFLKTKVRVHFIYYSLSRHGRDNLKISNPEIPPPHFLDIFISLWLKRNESD